MKTAISICFSKGTDRRINSKHAVGLSHTVTYFCFIFSQWFNFLAVVLWHGKTKNVPIVIINKCCYAYCNFIHHDIPPNIKELPLSVTKCIAPHRYLTIKRPSQGIHLISFTVIWKIPNRKYSLNHFPFQMGKQKNNLPHKLIFILKVKRYLLFILG